MLLCDGLKAVNMLFSVVKLELCGDYLTVGATLKVLSITALASLNSKEVQTRLRLFGRSDSSLRVADSSPSSPS